MPILMYPKCWRDRDDCQPVHCIEGVDESVTEEQYMSLDFEPDSFVCSGIIATDKREVEQDCYRLCFKNHVVDEMSDNDEQDLTHLINVASAALSVGATRKVNGGSIEVPTMQKD